MSKTHEESELNLGPIGDHDQAYTFGLPRQTANRAGPFTLRELARLTILHSRIGDTIAVPMGQGYLPGASVFG